MAKSLDERLMNCWVGHASFQVIDNVSCQDFNDKCNNVVQAISTRLGLKNNTTFGKNIRKRKYLVKNKVIIPVKYKEFIVEHQYLVSNDDGQTRIRKRQEVGSKSCHYTLTQRYQDVGDQKRVETRRILDPREFSTMCNQIDLTRSKIIKDRKCFLFKDVYYQLDEYKIPHKGLTLLEVYGQEDDDLQLPDWVQATEVTHDPEYSMFNLSKQTTTGPNIL